ncbi:hypothetical protein N8I77_004408 [Diaporthe amygdali]|uniref:Rhodopsin domain-containing protein n=1 Tax=Phomopsis amygdali TaxID=1214568 RepID=A0AAD9SJS2_PHOAM|nr:hypothetical protein N8I77_004408 [Diaporthe amygdali]
MTESCPGVLSCSLLDRREHLCPSSCRRPILHAYILVLPQFNAQRVCTRVLSVSSSNAMSSSNKSLEALIAQYASISKTAFRATAGVFYGIAVLSVLARGVIRFTTRRNLALDDYLLFAAFAFLTTVTALVYYLLDSIYLATAVERNPAVFFQFSQKQTQQLLSQALNENIFLLLAWTTTFLVKFSFLAFFKQLIRNVERIQKYYWGIVIFTIITWMFLTSEAFILCSDFGINAIKCWSPTKNTLYVSMTGLVTGLDALTDILIVSIPIIVLYRARMRTSQKISLGIFLCLSLVMVCRAIIRASKVHGAVSIDVVWVFFWQYMETVVAVIMGSLTVVRNLLVHQTKSNHNSPAAPGGSGGRNPRAAYRMGLLRRHKEKNIDNSTRDLPEVPAPTLSGLRTFIRRNNRDPGLDTQATQASTLVQDDTYYMAPSIEQSRIDPEEQGWEHHQHIYQTPPRTRARVWGSLQGDSTIQPSMTTTCTSTTLNDRDHY